MKSFGRHLLLNSFDGATIKLPCFFRITLLLKAPLRIIYSLFLKVILPLGATLPRLFVMYFTCQRLSATPNVMSHYKLRHIFKVHELQYSINDVPC